jgi:hypothetical protein
MLRVHYWSLCFIAALGGASAPLGRQPVTLRRRSGPVYVGGDLRFKSGTPWGASGTASAHYFGWPPPAARRAVMRRLSATTGARPQCMAPRPPRRWQIEKACSAAYAQSAYHCGLRELPLARPSQRRHPVAAGKACGTADGIRDKPITSKEPLARFSALPPQGDFQVVAPGAPLCVSEAPNKRAVVSCPSDACRRSRCRARSVRGNGMTFAVTLRGQPSTAHLR